MGEAPAQPNLVFQKFVNVPLLGLIERVFLLRAPDGLVNADGFAHEGAAPVPERTPERDNVGAARINGGLCKTLCHNLCCLVHSMYELGVDVDFTSPVE
jgi:hypothetical protein